MPAVHFLVLSAVDLDAVQAAALFHGGHNLLIRPRGFVHHQNSIQPPVRDKQPVSMNDQRKGVFDARRIDGLHICSV
uniref:Putative secreted protein n=1 Tax=Ixodes ricinus TaxID=34613 RepID=A0A6B0U302_IXORI